MVVRCLAAKVKPAGEQLMLSSQQVYLSPTCHSSEPLSSDVALILV